MNNQPIGNLIERHLHNHVDGKRGDSELDRWRRLYPGWTIGQQSCCLSWVLGGRRRGKHGPCKGSWGRVINDHPRDLIKGSSRIVTVSPYLGAFLGKRWQNESGLNDMIELDNTCAELGLDWTIHLPSPYTSDPDFSEDRKEGNTILIAVTASPASIAIESDLELRRSEIQRRIDRSRSERRCFLCSKLIPPKMALGLLYGGMVCVEGVCRQITDSLYRDYSVSGKGKKRSKSEFMMLLLEESDYKKKVPKFDTSLCHNESWIESEIRRRMLLSRSPRTAVDIAARGGDIRFCFVCGARCDRSVTWGEYLFVTCLGKCDELVQSLTVDYSNSKRGKIRPKSEVFRLIIEQTRGDQPTAELESPSMKTEADVLKILVRALQNHKGPIPLNPPKPLIDKHIKALAQKISIYVEQGVGKIADMSKEPILRINKASSQENSYSIFIEFGEKTFSSVYSKAGEWRDPSNKRAAIYLAGKRGHKRNGSEPSPEVKEPVPAKANVPVVSGVSVTYTIMLTVRPGDGDAIALFSLFMKKEGDCVRLLNIEASS